MKTYGHVTIGGNVTYETIVQRVDCAVGESKRLIYPSVTVISGVLVFIIIIQIILAYTYSQNVDWISSIVTVQIGIGLQ